MPRLHSSSHIVRVLQEHGFLYVSQKGSHAKFRRVDDDQVYTVIVLANKKEIPHGTFRSIVRQSGLSSEDFEVS
jgi:predicted RNA binding protein YcfA (HicA-like mRNA interferase family)